MIHTTDQLIDWLNQNIPDRNAVLRRALELGRVEVVGGVFAPLPTSQNNGWIVNLIEPYGTCHLLAIAEDRQRLGRYYWFQLACGTAINA